MTVACRNACFQHAAQWRYSARVSGRVLEARVTCDEEGRTLHMRRGVQYEGMMEICYAVWTTSPIRIICVNG